MTQGGKEIDGGAMAEYAGETATGGQQIQYYAFEQEYFESRLVSHFSNSGERMSLDIPMRIQRRGEGNVERERVSSQLMILIGRDFSGRITCSFYSNPACPSVDISASVVPEARLTRPYSTSSLSPTVHVRICPSHESAFLVALSSPPHLRWTCKVP